MDTQYLKSVLEADLDVPSQVVVIEEALDDESVDAAPVEETPVAEDEE
jgi:hypothetical protein